MSRSLDPDWYVLMTMGKREILLQIGHLYDACFIVVIGRFLFGYQERNLNGVARVSRRVRSTSFLVNDVGDGMAAVVFFFAQLDLGGDDLAKYLLIGGKRFGVFDRLREVACPSQKVDLD